MNNINLKNSVLNDKKPALPLRTFQTTFLALLMGLVSLPAEAGSASKNRLYGVVNKTGPVQNAKITVYVIKNNGKRGRKLGRAQTDAAGNFAVKVPRTYRKKFLETVAEGGSYINAYDGALLDSQYPITALVRPQWRGPENKVSITPVSELIAARTKTLVQSGEPKESALNRATQLVSTIYGLKHDPSTTIPRYEAEAVTDDPQGAQLALLLGGMYVVAYKELSSYPDFITKALSLDLADGFFDGKTGASTLTISGNGIASTTGTVGVINGSALYASAVASGIVPEYAAYHAETIDIFKPDSSIIKVYVADDIPRYSAGNLAGYQGNTSPLPGAAPDPNPPTTAENPTTTGSQPGYSCNNGATLYFENGYARCSDGSIAVYTAPTITPYTANTIKPYVASDITPYIAGLITPVSSPTIAPSDAVYTVGDPSEGSTPIYTSATNIHVFSQEERDAMNKNMQKAWNEGKLKKHKADGGSGKAPMNPLQAAWYGVLNHNISVWYSGNPFR